MDELTLLRATRSEIPEPSLDDLEAGFARLEQRMSRRRPSARRRLVPIAAVAAAAIAVTAVGQTTVTVQSAQAATVLNEAADNTIHTVDPVVGPGQYLKVETVAQSRSFGDGYSWVAPQTVDVYEPGDPSKEWTLVHTYQRPTVFFGTDAKQKVLSGWEANHQPELVHAVNGEFYGDPWQQFDIPTLPRDPQALLDWFDRYNNGGGASRAEENWENMVELLRSGIPADLRASLYKALALLPGVSVGDRTATLDGRTGVAIGRTEWLRGGDRKEIVVDPSTGQLIGEREISLLPVSGFTAGEVIGSTSVTTTVVNSAP